MSSYRYGFVHRAERQLMEHLAWNDTMPTYAILHSGNRRFPEITDEDKLTVFSYSRRVKSPEWRRQLGRADLRHF